MKLITIFLFVFTVCAGEALAQKRSENSEFRCKTVSDSLDIEFIELKIKHANSAISSRIPLNPFRFGWHKDVITKLVSQGVDPTNCIEAICKSRTEGLPRKKGKKQYKKCKRSYMGHVWSEIDYKKYNKGEFPLLRLDGSGALVGLELDGQVRISSEKNSSKRLRKKLHMDSDNDCSIKLDWDSIIIIISDPDLRADLISKKNSRCKNYYAEDIIDNLDSYDFKSNRYLSNCKRYENIGCKYFNQRIAKISKLALDLIEEEVSESGSQKLRLSYSKVRCEPKNRNNLEGALKEIRGLKNIANSLYTCNDISIGETKEVDSATFGRVTKGDSIPTTISDYSIKRINSKKLEISLPINFVSTDFLAEESLQSISSSSSSLVSKNKRRRVSPEAEMKKRKEIEVEVRQRAQECLSAYSKALRGPTGETLNIKIGNGDAYPVETAQSSRRRMSTYHGSKPVLIDKKNSRNRNNIIELTDKYNHRSNSANWKTSIDYPTILHEVMHLFGLVDEYHESHSHYYKQGGRWVFRKSFSSVHARKKASLSIGRGVTNRYRFSRDCRQMINDSSVMSDQGTATKEIVTSWKDESKLIPKTFKPGSSILAPAHWNAILYPGCNQKNKDYYYCGKFSYISSVNGDGELCPEVKRNCSAEKVIFHEEPSK